jgi:hypothetical protein
MRKRKLVAVIVILVVYPILLMGSLAVISSVYSASIESSSPASQPRNQWGQRGAPGCETILQWTERCSTTT